MYQLLSANGINNSYTPYRYVVEKYILLITNLGYISQSIYMLITLFLILHNAIGTCTYLLNELLYRYFCNGPCYN